MKKLTMMLQQALALALVAAPFAASAVDCITDVMVVGGENKSVTSSYAAQGWKVIPKDLNAGAGGDWVFLLYKTADSASVSNGFITSFYIKTGAVTNELTHAGRVYRLASCDGDAGFVAGKGDLNSNTTKQGDVIHLYYTKSAMPGNRVVTGITFNADQSDAVGKNGGTAGYKWENEQWVASDGSSSGFSFKADNAQIQTVGKDVATLQSEGWITADGVLASEHDAVQAQWGGGWRMPTKQELDDLVNNCDWIWTAMNGVSGYEVRGRGDYASASIFLPRAGYGHGTSLCDAGSYGDYWSSVPTSDNSTLAWCFYFNSGSHNTNYNGYRIDGLSVRPVQDVK